MIDRLIYFLDFDVHDTDTVSFFPWCWKDECFMMLCEYALSIDICYVYITRRG